MPEGSSPGSAREVQAADRACGAGKLGWKGIGVSSIVLCMRRCLLL